MARKLRPAIEIISDIGSLGFDLQHHDDKTIADAMVYMRQANPEMFAWIASILAPPKSEQQP